MPETTFEILRLHVSQFTGLEIDPDAEQDIMESWINEGYEQFIADTHCDVDSATLSFTADQHTYDLPTEAMAVLEVYTTGADGTVATMQRCTLQEIIEMRRLNTTGGDARYYSVQGANLILVHPTPDSSSDSLTLYYVPRPTPMTADEDTPEGIPPEYHKAVEFYALARAGEYDENGPSQFGTYWLARYEREVKRCKASIHEMGGNRAAPLTAGMPGWRSQLSNDRSRIFNW